MVFEHGSVFSALFIMVGLKGQSYFPFRSLSKVLFHSPQGPGKRVNTKGVWVGTPCCFGDLVLRLR